MEPVNLLMPEPGYLEGVRDLAHEHGALLVFDEMVTAFRLAPGGAQELFGVTPDLAALGKGIANGMPLSAVVGRRKYMRRLPEVAYGMTFRGETLSLAAARAVLRVVRTEPVADHLARIGSDVRAAFERACATHGVLAELMGPPARMTFVFGDDAGVPPERVETAFLRECARRGVLTNANILPSYAHDAEAVERTAEVFDEALGAATDYLSSGRVAMAEAIRTGLEATGSEPPADSALPGGYLDATREDGPQLLVRGWLLPRGRAPDTIERRDVAAAFGAVDAEMCGFAATLPADSFASGDEYEFTLRSRLGDEIVFACPIRRPRDSHRSVTVRHGRFEDRTLHI
jgi:hypothetical protein